VGGRDKVKCQNGGHRPKGGRRDINQDGIRAPKKKKSRMGRKRGQNCILAKLVAFSKIRAQGEPL